MKALYEFTENTDLLELTIGLQNLFGEVLSIKSSYSWNAYARIYSGKEDNIISKMDELHLDIDAYRLMLEDFIQNRHYYEDKSCIDKFFNGAILKVRERAISSINVLRTKANNTSDANERFMILEIVNDMIDVINLYLDLVRDYVQNNSTIQKLTQRLGINYLEKYDLSDIR